MRNGPPGMWTRSFGLIFQDRKLQLALVSVHAVEEHAYAIADGKLAARALAHNLANVLLISVLVAGQRVDGDQPFDEQVGQLHEEAVFGGADEIGRAHV